MREIKFRAWLKKEKQIKRVDEIGISEGWVEVQGGIQPYLFGDINLMQYTGLKDKNGVEIYEGDIVEITTIDNFTHQPVSISKEVVSFNVANARFENATHFCEVSVIGNIHENPELLERA